MAEPIYTFQVSQSDDGGTIYLSDITGDYNVSTNPGGYGAPNTARTDLALILIVNYKAIAGDESIAVSGYDPEVVTQWTMPNITKDGHYEFKVYQVPRSGTEGAPVSGMFRWDFATNLLERYNGSTWVTSAAVDGIYVELEQYDRPHTTVNYPILYDLWMANNNINKLYILGSKTTARADLQKAIFDTKTMMSGVIAIFAEGNYQQAQENIEKYQSRVDALIALT